MLYEVITHPEAPTDGRVGVDHFRHVVDQFDDLLGHEIAGGRLAADQHATGGPVLVVPSFEPVVEMDDVENVEQLSFVFVDTLDLYIKHRFGGELDAAPFVHQTRQPDLVVLLDLSPMSSEIAIFRNNFV